MGGQCVGERPKDNGRAGDTQAHICAYRGLVETVCVYMHVR